MQHICMQYHLSTKCLLCVFIWGWVISLSSISYRGNSGWGKERESDTSDEEMMTEDRRMWEAMNRRKTRGKRPNRTTRRSSGRKKGVLMKARWRRELYSITGPHRSPPSLLFLSEPPPITPRGTTPALHLRFISNDHIHAAWRWIGGGVRSHPDEQREPTTQQEPSNPQPLVSQDSKKSNWIRINVGATLPS